MEGYRGMTVVKKETFYPRNKYTLLIVKRGESLEECIRKEYPLSPAKEKIYRLKLRGKSVCLIFNEGVPFGCIPLGIKYAANRCRNFTGTVMLKRGDSGERFVFEKGIPISAGIVQKNDATRYDRYLDPLKDDVKNRDCINIISRRTMFARAVAAAILFVSVLFILFMGKRSDIKRMNLMREQEKVRAEAEKKRLAMDERLSSELESVRAEYEKYFHSENCRIYEMLSSFLKSLKKSRVQSISVDGRKFMAVIKSPLPTDCLSGLERNPFVKNVLMDRISHGGGNDTVSFSGEFSPAGRREEMPVSKAEQIAWYRKKMAEKKKYATYSEYASSLRDKAGKYGCKEEYMQVKETSDSIVTEYSVQGSALKILSFLKAIEDDGFTLESVFIKNEKSLVTSRINLSESLLSFTEEKREMLASEQNLSPRELSGFFGYREMNSVPSAKKTSSRKAVPPPAKEAVRSGEVKITGSTLVFVGKTRTSENKEYVFVKDGKQDALYKVLLNGDGNFSCVQDGNGSFVAYINGKTYRIVK